VLHSLPLLFSGRIPALAFFDPDGLVVLACNVANKLVPRQILGGNTCYTAFLAGPLSSRPSGLIKTSRIA